MSVSIPVRLAEVVQAVNAPAGYARALLQGMFHIPVDVLVPAEFDFLEVPPELAVNGYLRNGAGGRILIGIALPDATKETILEYVVAHAPSILNVAQWEGKTFPPEEGEDYVAPEPEPEEPPAEEPPAEEPPAEEPPAEEPPAEEPPAEEPPAEEPTPPEGEPV